MNKSKRLTHLVVCKYYYKLSHASSCQQYHVGALDHTLLGEILTFPWRVVKFNDYSKVPYPKDKHNLDRKQLPKLYSTIQEVL